MTTILPRIVAQVSISFQRFFTPAIKQDKHLLADLLHFYYLWCQLIKSVQLVIPKYYTAHLILLQCALPQPLNKTRHLYESSHNLRWCSLCDPSWEKRAHEHIKFDHFLKLWNFITLCLYVRSLSMKLL